MEERYALKTRDGKFIGPGGQKVDDPTQATPFGTEADARWYAGQNKSRLWDEASVEVVPHPGGDHGAD